MTKFERLWIYLSGKKAVIALILAATNGYLLEMNAYGSITFVFLIVILGLLFGKVSIETKKAFKVLEASLTKEEK